MDPMDNQQCISAAQDQLNRTLGFFPRVDAKASVVFGVNTGMLAVLVTGALPYEHLTWQWVPVGVSVLLFATSYWHLYRESFPSLEGDDESLLYFRSISYKAEDDYVASWQRMPPEEYLSDLLQQVWRNSEILKQKFDHVSKAFYALALAVVPWLIALASLQVA